MTVSVLWLFFTVPGVGVCVIVVFSYHSHLLICLMYLALHGNNQIIHMLHDETKKQDLQRQGALSQRLKSEADPPMKVLSQRRH